MIMRKKLSVVLLFMLVLILPFPGIFAEPAREASSGSSGVIKPLTGVRGELATFTKGARTVDDVTWHYIDTPNFRDGTTFVWPVHITAIGDVLEDGVVIGAIKIEYSGEIDAGIMTPVNFQVPGRKVIESYVNNSDKRKDAAQKGKYLFLELLINEDPDSNEFKEISGNYKFDPSGTNWAIDLPLVIAVRQINTLYSANGRTIAPFNKHNDDQYIEIVDEFIPGVYRDPATGIQIKYNLFVPEAYRGRNSLPNLPLVFFLHGSGESGYDNRATLTAYRQVQEYCTPEAQADTPCFVMIPQCTMSEERGRTGNNGGESGWYTFVNSTDGKSVVTMPSKILRAAINAMLNDVVPKYNVDTNRIYSAGHSMGGGGATAALIERPDIFAATGSFASNNIYSDEMLMRIKDKPIFFTKAADESNASIKANMTYMMAQFIRLGIPVYQSIGTECWDAALRGKAAQLQAEDTIAKAKAAGANMIYIEFMPGSVVNVAHHSHRASFENAGIRHWLFSQRLDRAAYANVPSLTDYINANGTSFNTDIPKAPAGSSTPWVGGLVTTAGNAKTVDDLNYHYIDTPNFNDASKFVWPKHITAIGTVLEDGLVASAIKIEYSDEVDAGILLPLSFQVPGRKVIHTYVNNSGKRGEIATKGIYFFAELLINELPDSNDFKEISGNYKFDPRGGNWAIDLPICTAIRQIDTKYSSNGRTIAPFNKKNDDQYIEVVDEMVQGVYRDPATGIRIKYNLFVPEGYSSKGGKANLPLVLFFHGAGESGYDNRATVTAYRQVQEYMTPEAQAENPCFIMIPQCPMTEERGRGVPEEFGWNTFINNATGTEVFTLPSKSVRAVINTMLNDVIPKYNIDTARLYTAGHSMGGGGASGAIIERPDVFAAGVSFSSAVFYPADMLQRIKDKPIFFTMGEDDPLDRVRTTMPPLMDDLERAGARVFRVLGNDAWNAALRGASAQKLADDAAAKARAAGATMIFAEYVKGSSVPNGHLTHRASFENAGIRHWLFQQRLR